MGFLRRVMVPKPIRKPLRAATAVKNPVGYARRQVTPKPVKKALKVAHPVSTLETAAAGAVNRAGSRKRGSRTEGSADMPEELANRATIAVSEGELPAPIDSEVFMAWERHRVRLENALGKTDEPAPRYRDLILITNVMARQYEMVETSISEVGELAAQAEAVGDASIVPDAQRFTAWAGPWIEAFDRAFQEFKAEREALGKALPADERTTVENDTGALFDAIKQDPMAVLQKRLEELKKQAGI